jgi:hypothetical protein
MPPVTLIHYLIVIHMADVSRYELQAHKDEIFDYIMNVGGQGGRLLEFIGRTLWQYISC